MEDHQKYSSDTRQALLRSVAVFSQVLDIPVPIPIQALSKEPGAGGLSQLHRETLPQPPSSGARRRHEGFERESSSMPAAAPPYPPAVHQSRPISPHPSPYHAGIVGISTTSPGLVRGVTASAPETEGALSSGAGARGLACHRDRDQSCAYDLQKVKSPTRIQSGEDWIKELEATSVGQLRFY